MSSVMSLRRPSFHARRVSSYGLQVDHVTSSREIITDTQHLLEHIQERLESPAAGEGTARGLLYPPESFNEGASVSGRIVATGVLLVVVLGLAACASDANTVADARSGSGESIGACYAPPPADSNTRVSCLDRHLFQVADRFKVSVQEEAEFDTNYTGDKANGYEPDVRVAENRCDTVVSRLQDSWQQSSAYPLSGDAYPVEAGPGRTGREFVCEVSMADDFGNANYWTGSLLDGTAATAFQTNPE